MTKKIDFATAEKTKKTLIKLANAVYNDEIDESKAKTLTYMAQTVLTSIRADEQQKQLDEQQQKLDELEAKLKEL